MDKVAMWVGYAAMIAGGVGVVLAALWLVAEGCWRWWVRGLNAGDIRWALP